MTGCGTLSAYLADHESANNTFTAGDVSISLTEPSWPGETRVVANETVPKDPIITNTGINDALVFLKVSVPVKCVSLVGEDGKLTTTGEVTETFLMRHLDEDGNYVPGFNDTGVYTMAKVPAAEGVWQELYTKEQFGVEDGDYTEYVLAYTKALKPGETTGAAFDAVKYQAVLEGYSTMSQINPNTKYKIYLDAYAIQAADSLDKTDVDVTEILRDGGSLDEETLNYIWEVYFNQNDPDHYSMTDFDPNDPRFDTKQWIQEPGALRKESSLN